MQAFSDRLKTSRPYGLGFLFFLVLVILDQITKLLAYRSSFGNFLNVLHPFFGKRDFPNANFAFSIPIYHPIAYIVFLLLMIWLVWWYIRVPKKTTIVTIGFILILAGAFGNLYDRITLGYVRDFIYAFWGNVFDLADVYILTGIVFLFL